MRVAITGATGFVGRHLLDRVLAAGHRVAALTRRLQAPRDGVAWVDGALDRPDALARLVVGADVVIHVAGVVNAPDRAGFVAGNVEGTRAVVAAATAAGAARFVHVSSLAAREPGLSTYGWSKAEGERVVTDSRLPWTIVRPPAVYGPGDTELRDVFRVARRFRVVPLPSDGRMSAIAVENLADLLLAIAERGALGQLFEPDDGAAITQRDFALAIGRAVGRRVTPIVVPPALLAAGAWADRRWRGDAAKLTPDRVAYMTHPDWAADPALAPPPALWRPRLSTAEALADTARWYRGEGLL